jgi:hypothetical protein
MDSCYASKMYSRAFTDFRSMCRVDSATCAQKNITNSYEYRRYLTDNANKIMEQNRRAAVGSAYCWNCTAPQVTWTTERPIRHTRQ